MGQGNPLDLFDVCGALGDEECLVPGAVVRFANAELLPIIGTHVREHMFACEQIGRLAELGLWLRRPNLAHPINLQCSRRLTVFCRSCAECDVCCRSDIFHLSV